MMKGQNRKGVLTMLLRKAISVLLLMLTVLLTGCTGKPGAPHTAPVRLQNQSRAQLHLGLPEPEPEPAEIQEKTVIAAWIPYFIVEALLSAPDPEAAVNELLDALQSFGVNTVFVHVCAFGESIYPSAYYPLLPAAADSNALPMIRDACRAHGIAFHAWINPLRLQTAEYMEMQSGTSRLHRMYSDPETRKTALSEWSGRYYLNPAADSTADFLAGAVTELITGYSPDGIHIDDYFYPTAETAFDAADFAASGEEDLGQWRRSSITKLIRRMNAAVHAADPGAVFSVSPQGKLTENLDVQFADVQTWLREDGCCDWIIPQLYFGYQNPNAPFSELLRSWTTLPRRDGIRLIIGLAAYKDGQTDPHAGEAAEEWRTTPLLLVQQAEDVLSDGNTDGVALYHAVSLRNLPENTAASLRKVLADTVKNAAEP